MNCINASPTTAKGSAVLTSSFVMEVSSVMKGGMGLVGWTNSEQKASSILTSKMTAANSMILSLSQLLPVVSRSKTK
jgi:hypothetical protein